MAKPKPEYPISSHTILATLQAKLWQGQAYAWLFEVRNGTGWQRQERYADAIVVSCYPSRGIYCHGLEAKISRSDWVRELREPAKSAAIQKYCKHWWVVAPPGIVKLEELPATWGLIEVEPPNKYKIAKRAPELQAEEPNWTFVASMLRNSSERERCAETRGKEQGRIVEQEKQATAVAKLMADQAALPDFTKTQQELERLKAVIEDFERRTGLNLTSRWRAAEHTAKALKIAAVLEGHGFPENLPEILKRWKYDADTITNALTAAINAVDPQKDPNANP